MAMGRQKDGQGDLMVSWSEMPRSPGHVFYDRLQSVLIEGGFDAFAEASCRPYYAARMGAPSVPPGCYFRMHLVGHFEGIDSERGPRSQPAKPGPIFADRGLTLRNEAEAVCSVALQDLLAEEAPRILVLTLRLATTERAGLYWSECLQALASLRAARSDDDVAQTRLSCELDRFAREFRSAHSEPVAREDDARAVVGSVYDFVGRNRLIAAHPAYRQGDWFGKVTEAATRHLWRSAADADDWAQTLDAYEGKGAVPLMTIHKSKGLE